MNRAKHCKLCRQKAWAIPESSQAATCSSRSKSTTGGRAAPAADHSLHNVAPLFLDSLRRVLDQWACTQFNSLILTQYQWPGHHEVHARPKGGPRWMDRKAWPTSFRTYCTRLWHWPRPGKTGRRKHALGRGGALSDASRLSLSAQWLFYPTYERYSGSNLNDHPEP